MIRFSSLLMGAGLLATGAAAAAMPTTVAQMRWHRRILLVTAPDAANPQLALQRRVLREWRGGGDRDLSVVQLVGGAVEGAGDTATGLRRRFKLPPDRFAALLIGKDGGVKLRSAQPLSPDTLQDTIDAMPMRQAGQR